MPPAARITDNHTCPMTDPKPHVGGPIVTGEPTVLIGNRQAARLGDKTHVGVIVQGCPTVLIGSDNVAGCFLQAAENGMAFVTQAGKR